MISRTSWIAEVTATSSVARRVSTSTWRRSSRSSRAFVCPSRSSAQSPPAIGGAAWPELAAALALLMVGGLAAVRFARFCCGVEGADERTRTYCVFGGLMKHTWPLPSSMFVYGKAHFRFFGLGYDIGLSAGGSISSTKQA